MTINQARAWREYWREQAKYHEYQYIVTKNEADNDAYVRAVDHIELIELALNQLYATEERRRTYGVPRSL